MISQNNSIVISVCNLACAARFRANAGAKSVGMIDRPHAHPSYSETILYGPLQFPTEREIQFILFMMYVHSSKFSDARHV
jgi:hypothetical protein